MSSTEVTREYEVFAVNIGPHAAQDLKAELVALGRGEYEIVRVIENLQPDKLVFVLAK